MPKSVFFFSVCVIANLKVKIPFVIFYIPEMKKYSFSFTWRSAWKDSNGFIADSCWNANSQTFSS